MKKILELSKAGFDAQHKRSARLANINLCVCEHDIAGVYVETEKEDIRLFDLAEGLVQPSRGYVEFMGKRWQDMNTSELLRNRSRIGRTLEVNAWLSNLTVLENVLLAERHHTKRPDENICEEADRLASALGIDEIPGGHIHEVPEPLVRKCEWVRVFMGEPSLVLVDLPNRKGVKDNLDKLLDLCRESAGSGSAILLMTVDSQIWERVRQETNLNFILGLDGTLKPLEKCQ